MKRRVEKPLKVCLCRKCRGTGLYRHKNQKGVTFVERCPQCEGSGRVTVSAVMDFDIKPYKA